MWQRLCVVLVAWGCALIAAAQTNYSAAMLPLIMQDIYEDLLEQGQTVDFEELTEELSRLHENPINLNATSADELRQIPFLSDEQIDAILLLVYRQPLHSLYELQLADHLKDYQIRNLLPFVFVGSIEKNEPFYWKEMWHYAHHEVDLRLDARQIETNRPDPFYTSLKYRFNYGKRVDFGLVMERDPQEPFYYPHKTYGADFYGGWLQLRDVWKFRNIVAGDYRVTFGQGLVINTNMRFGGKLSMLANSGFRREGLQRKSSTAEADFLRGVGATLALGKVDVSAFYSARKVDGRVNDNVFPSIQNTGYHRTDAELSGKRAVWQQVVGLNTTLRLKQARIGLTVTEHLLGDTLVPRTTYYNHNYFSGKRQFAAGINYQWYIRRFMLFGEVATAQNSTWGIANITGLRYSLPNDVSLVALYRYYSPHYDNLLANAFSETSRQNDENGLMVGADIGCVKRWRFSVYGDIFRFAGAKYAIRTYPTWGGEALLQAQYEVNRNMSMQWKVRTKWKGEKEKYQLRYNLSAQAGQWLLKTTIEGNLLRQSGKTDVSLGGVVAQQVEYSFSAVPVVLQARAEAFYTADYDNRIYLYENDVLYAFSIPMLYGKGGRWMLNFRYKINDMFSVYLKTAQTLYSQSWATERNLGNRTRSEVHTMLRIKI